MEVGLDPGRFWHLTPKEVAREMAAVIKRLSREQNERAWLAWHIAALGRVKKLPKLKDLMTAKATPKPSKPQSPDVQLAMMKSMFLAFGGDPADLEKVNGR